MLLDAKNKEGIVGKFLLLLILMMVLLVAVKEVASIAIHGCISAPDRKLLKFFVAQWKIGF